MLDNKGTTPDEVRSIIIDILENFSNDEIKNMVLNVNDIRIKINKEHDVDAMKEISSLKLKREVIFFCHSVTLKGNPGLRVKEKEKELLGKTANTYNSFIQQVINLYYSFDKFIA